MVFNPTRKAKGFLQQRAPVDGESLFPDLRPSKVKKGRRRCPLPLNERTEVPDADTQCRRHPCREVT